MDAYISVVKHVPYNYTLSSSITYTAIEVHNLWLSQVYRGEDIKLLSFSTRLYAFRALPNMFFAFSNGIMCMYPSCYSLRFIFLRVPLLSFELEKKNRRQEWKNTHRIFCWYVLVLVFCVNADHSNDLSNAHKDSRVAFPIVIRTLRMCEWIKIATNVQRGELFKRVIALSIPMKVSNVNNRCHLIKCIS